GVAIVRSGFADFTPTFTATCPEGSRVAASIIYPSGGGSRTAPSPGGTNRVAAISDKSIEWRTAQPSDMVPRLVVLTTQPPSTSPQGSEAPGQPTGQGASDPSGAAVIKPPVTGSGGLVNKGRSATVAGGPQ